MTPHRPFVAEYSLRLPQNGIEAVMRPMLFEPGRVALGKLRCRGSDEQRWATLNGKLSLSSSVPHGVEHPPLEDLLVLTADPTGTLTARRLLERFEPRPSQTVVAWVVNTHREQLGGWDGVVCEQGSIQPLHEVVLTGAAPVRLSRESMWLNGIHDVAEVVRLQSPNSHEFGYERNVEDNARDGRWSRLAEAVGPRVLRAIQQTSVLLVGAGGLGTLLAESLTCLGVRRLKQVDDDVLDLSNLNRMPGVPESECGHLKVAALGRLLTAMRQDLSYVGLPQSIIHLREQLTEPFDLVVAAVDHDAARLAASLVARESQAVYLDVGTHVARTAPNDRTESNSVARSLTADVRVLLPNEGCPACFGDLNLDAVLNELGRPPDCLQRGVPVEWHEQRAGSELPWNMLCAATAMRAWLDLLAGSVRTSMWHRLEWPAGGTVHSTAGPVGANAHCRVCRT